MAATSAKVVPGASGTTPPTPSEERNLLMASQISR
jgi:hypothetical protein